MKKPGECHGHQFRIVSQERTSARRVIACDHCGLTLDHIGQFTPVSQPECTMAPAGAQTRSVT